ncbi:DUF6777 domain-containing protein [Streptomyces sp. NPDC002309]
MAVTAAVAAVGLAVVFTRPGGGPAEAGEVILQPTSSTGPDPYTQSTAKTTSSLPSAAPNTPAPKDNAIRSVTGSEPGLYGGTLNTASCDVEKQIRHLTSDRAKNKAFASVLALRESAVDTYLRSLTPVLLRSDTRVTNHGYRDGAATDYQAVLQAGTAVLVDGRGEPKVRCACGNPLTRAVPQKTAPQEKGTPWSGYRPQNVVVVNRSAKEIKEFVIFDASDRNWVRRDSGDQGDADRKTTAPARHWPLPPKEPPAKEPPAKEPPAKESPPTQESPDGQLPENDPGRDDVEPQPDYDSPEHKPNDPGTKPDENKPDQDKPEHKPEQNEPQHKPDQDKPEHKPDEDKPEHKPDEDKPDQDKPEHKPDEDKPDQDKPEHKPDQDKPDEDKPDQDKPEHKPDNPGTKPDENEPEHKPQEEEKPEEEKPQEEEQPQEEQPQEEQQPEQNPEVEQQPQEQQPQEEQQPQQNPEEEQQPQQNPEEEQQPQEDQQPQQPEQEQQPAPDINPGPGNQG